MSSTDSTPSKPVQATVIEILRKFLMPYLETQPVLSAVQKRAIWAIAACRTDVMGGNVHGCEKCGERHFSYYSCNHKACPLCGKAATAEWVAREQAKLIAAPYFMVTFTLPSELRDLFYGKTAKEAFDLFFKSCSGALQEVLARSKVLGAEQSAATMVLHTWNQQLLIHHHIHCIVPGAGLDAKGNYVEVRSEKYLVKGEVLAGCFKEHFSAGMKKLGWQCDPTVWRKEWSVNVEPFGNGENAVKYLGAYVSRSVIGNSRILKVTDTHVTFRYKDRDNKGQWKVATITGVEFTRRYLRHVLPKKMHAVRYIGFAHPVAKVKRAKVIAGCAAHPRRTQKTPVQPAQPATPEPKPDKAKREVLCPCCKEPMIFLGRLKPAWIMRRPELDQPPSRAPPETGGIAA